MIATIEPQGTTTLPQQRPQKDLLGELVQTVSASRLNLWNSCRLKFFFRYVLQITKPKTPALFVGSLVHLVLQAWSMARWKKEPFDLEMFKAFYHEEWAKDSNGIRWDGEEEQEKASGWNILECYFQQTPIKPDEKPEAVEVPVEADLGKHGLPKLIGILDLVRAGGRIVDFKTSGQTPNPELVKHTHETQMMCYAVLYRECTGQLERGLELHHLVKTKTPKTVITEIPPMSPQQQTRLFKLMDSYQEGLCREDFVPSAGFQCAGCEFIRECRQHC